jgi:hypothetical protein
MNGEENNTFTAPPSRKENAIYLFAVRTNVQPGKAEEFAQKWKDFYGSRKKENYENFRTFFKLVQPYEIRVREAFPDAGIPDQVELDRLYEQMLVEMLQDDFVGLFYLLTVWGQKP